MDMDMEDSTDRHDYGDGGGSLPFIPLGHISSGGIILKDHGDEITWFIDSLTDVQKAMTLELIDLPLSAFSLLTGIPMWKLPVRPLAPGMVTWEKRRRRVRRKARR